MQSSKDPTIEGVKDSSSEIEEKIEMQKVMEQVSQMDLPLINSNETVNYSPDIEQKDQQSVVLQGSEANKKKLSEKRIATLQKAREALKEKRRRMKADGENGKQGMPANDVLVNIMQKIDSKFEAFEKQLHSYQKYVAHEDPLQSNGLVSENNIKKVQSIDGETFINVASNTSKRNVQSEENIIDSEKIVNNRALKLQKLFNTFEFNTKEVEARNDNNYNKNQYYRF